MRFVLDTTVTSETRKGSRADAGVRRWLAPVDEVDKNDQHVKKRRFYGRFGNGTRAIKDPHERERYKVQIWGPQTTLTLAG